MAMHRSSGQGMRSRPRSRVGPWSVVLAGLDVVSVGLILRALVSGVVALPQGFTDNGVLGAWGQSIVAIGAACVVTGVIAVALAMIVRRWSSWPPFGLLPVALPLPEAALGKV
jgi:hypothetical protein